MVPRMAGVVGAIAQVDNPSRRVIAWSAVDLLFAGQGGMIALRLSRDERPGTG
jgi:hypothetical protein